MSDIIIVESLERLDETIAELEEKVLEASCLKSNRVDVEEIRADWAKIVGVEP